MPEAPGHSCPLHYRYAPTVFATAAEVRERGTAFCVGTPADCIRFLERYEALGIDEVFLLCAIGLAQHREVLHTIRLFGEQVIPHFQAETPRAGVYAGGHHRQRAGATRVRKA